MENSDWVPFQESEIEIGGYDMYCNPNYLSPWHYTKDRQLHFVLQSIQFREEDILYDLGCGDARVLIEASKIGCRKGVGIDLDPDMVEMANNKLQDEGVENVIVLQGSFLEVDLTEATVIYLFLLPQALELLLPVLSELFAKGRLRLIISNLYEIEKFPYTCDYNEEFKVYFYTPVLSTRP